MSKKKRLLARENWVQGLTDKDNAASIGVHLQTIYKWRKDSSDPESSTYDENWYVHREEIVTEAAKRYEHAQTTFFIEQAYNARSELITHENRHKKALNMFESLLMSELIPQKIQNPDGTTSLKVDSYNKERIKAIGDAFSTYRQIASDKKESIMPQELEEQIKLHMEMLSASTQSENPLSSFENFLDTMNSMDDDSFLDLDPAYKAQLLEAKKSPEEKIINIEASPGGEETHKEETA